MGHANPRNETGRERFWRYAVSVIAILSGLAFRFALHQSLGSNVPYLTLFPAVMFAAWYGGLGPGIMAAILAVFSAMFLLNPPFFHAALWTVDDWVRAVVFLAFSIFISVLTDVVRRARARTGEHLERLQRETERLKQAEQSLTESRDLLHTTLSSIGDAVIAADADGNVTFLNTIAHQLTGWSQKDAAGKPISEVFVARDEATGDLAEDPVRKAIVGNTAISVAKHTVLVTRDGRRIPIEDSASPIRDQQQRVLGAVLVFRDVTERRRSEEALKRSEERSKLALDAGKIGVWDWSVADNRIEWSDHVYDIHGVERDTDPGAIEEYSKRIHPEDRERVQGAIQAALQQDMPYDISFRVIRPDGNVRWVATKGLVLRNSKGEPLRMLGATTDVHAQRQAELNLRQQWHTFDTSLSNTPDHHFILDRDRRFTYANRALLSLWQKSLTDVVGKNYLELDYSQELAERVIRQIQEVFDSKQPVRSQTSLNGHEGGIRHYDNILVPVLAVDGQVEAVAGSTRDITESTEAESALRESEERLTFALEAGGGVGTWDWHIPSGRVHANARFADLFSLDQQSAAAGAPLKQFSAHIHPDDRLRMQESIRQAVATGADFMEECRIIHPDGVHWLHARGRCHMDAAGNPDRFPGVAFDITERKRADENLRESQRRLRAIYDGTYEFIGLLAPDGTLLEANRSSLEFANSSREALLGRKFWDTPWFAYTPGASEVVRDGVTRAAAGEFIRYEALLHSPGGQTAAFDISFYPILNERGEVVLIVPEGRDITELKQVEENLRRSNEELTRLNRNLEEFAYVASHDLQEPLRMVNIYSQMIVRDAALEGGKLNEYSAQIKQGVNRMETLIRDLLDFSRAVQADHEPIGTADLDAAAAEALALLKSRVDESGALITVCSLPTVRGETMQMSHVFQNLLSNALKYHKEGTPPEITISAQQSGNEWIIAVRDNGIGFEQRYAERIFGLFKRLYRDEYPGTGLGLAICKRIVERFGGRIWAESSPAEGSVFFFSLRSS